MKTLLLHLPGARDQALTQRGIVQQAFGLGDQVGQISGRAEQRGLFMGQHIRYAADGEGGDRRAELHGLQQHHRRAFGARAQHQCVQGAQPVSHVVLVAGQQDAPGQSGRRDTRFQFAPLRPLAQQHHGQRGVTRT